MTTKEQELKALDKIRAIITGLGEDSYVGTAFEGCLEIAAQNIDWDAAFSMKEERDLAEKQVNELKQVRDDLVEENKSLNEMINGINETAIEQRGKIEDLKSERNQLQVRVNELEQDAQEARSRVAELESQIIGLKAKLYDMITGA